MRSFFLSAHVPQSAITVALILLLVLTALIGYHLSANQPLTEHEQIHTIREDGHTYESNGIIFLAAEDAIQRTWGRQKTVLRALPEVSACLTFLTVFLIGRQLGSNKVGLCSAFMIASSSWMLAIGAHARFYSLNILFIATSTLFLLLGLRYSKRYWWALYLIALLGAIGTMLPSASIIVIHLLIAFRYPTERERSHYLTANQEDHRHALQQSEQFPENRQNNYRSAKKIRTRWALTLSCLLAMVSVAFLTWRDHEAMTRLTYAPISVRTLSEQANLFLGSGITRCHFPEYYNESADDCGAPLKNVVYVLQSLLILSLILTLRPSLCPCNSAASPLSSLSEREHHYVRQVTIALLITWALPLIYVIWKGQNIINDSSFTWQLPLVAVVFGTALAHRRWLRWATLTAMFILAPLACQATYMHGCGNEYIALWLQDHTNERDEILIDSITLRDFHRILPADCAQEMLGRAADYVQPLGVRSEIIDVGDFEEYRLRNALRQVPNSYWRTGQRIYIVTEHKSDIKDPERLLNIIAEKARKKGGNAHTLLLHDGRLHGLCIYMVSFQKLGFERS